LLIPDELVDFGKKLKLDSRLVSEQKNNKALLARYRERFGELPE